MTVYLLDEPFETKVGNVKKPVVVVAYDSETGHFWFGRSNDWHCGSAIVGFFNPPPPIPAAARKPKRRQGSPSGGNKAEAARMLKMARGSLDRMVREYGLVPKQRREDWHNVK
jgi:hypothetical protein